MGEKNAPLEGRMPMTLGAYAQYAHDQFMTRSPGDAMRGYAAGWRNVLDDIYAAGKNPAAPGGQFEVTSTVIARWEFLGGLYTGESAEKTDVKHAVAYARRFLSQYNHVHNLSGSPGCGTDCSEFFTMLRNKPLHGFTPAGVQMHGQQAIMAWGIGSAPGRHLRIVNEGVLVDCPTLVADLCDSVAAFADVLDQNSDVLIVAPNSRIAADHRNPQDRWKRGFWARFCPVHVGVPAWTALGENSYGIPR